MQTYKYNNFADCVRKTYKAEHIRGFFRGTILLWIDYTNTNIKLVGVTAPIASVTVVRTVSFSMYQRSKYTYSDLFKRNFGVDPMQLINTPGNYPTAATIACVGLAGATSGSFITLVACELRFTRRVQ
jgi:NhaP-type Na+/H+ or K+/H+ antiporter